MKKNHLHNNCCRNENTTGKIKEKNEVMKKSERTEAIVGKIYVIH